MIDFLTRLFCGLMSIQYLSNEPFDEHRSIFDFDFSSSDPAAFSSQVKHLTASTKKCIAVNHAQLEEVVCVISHISKCSKFQIDDNHCQHAFLHKFQMSENVARTTTAEASSACVHAATRDAASSAVFSLQSSCRAACFAPAASGRAIGCAAFACCASAACLRLPLPQKSGLNKPL